MPTENATAQRTSEHQNRAALSQTARHERHEWNKSTGSRNQEPVSALRTEIFHSLEQGNGRVVTCGGWLRTVLERKRGGRHGSDSVAVGLVLRDEVLQMNHSTTQHDTARHSTTQHTTASQYYVGGRVCA
jgi:hypothetical protein